MDIIQEHINLLRAQFDILQRMHGTVRRYRAGRNCQRGYNCGGSCITRRKNCRKALEGEAKNFGEWMVSKMSANIGAVVGEAPVDKPNAEPPKATTPDLERYRKESESLTHKKASVPIQYMRSGAGDKWEIYTENKEGFDYGDGIFVGKDNQIYVDGLVVGETNSQKDAEAYVAAIKSLPEITKKDRKKLSMLDLSIAEKIRTEKDKFPSDFFNR